MNNKISNLVISKSFLSILLAGTISFTLVGCGVNENKVDSNNTTNQEQTIEEENTTGMTNALTDEYEKIKGDDAVEAAITVMIDGVEYLDSAADDVKQSEDYQKAKDGVVSNFDTLLGFLFNGKEINGYTVHDISDTTKQKAKDALYTLDNYIERNIPDYKDKAKEKLEKAGAWLWDKSTDLGATITEKGSQWLDDVKDKTGKQR